MFQFSLGSTRVGHGPQQIEGGPYGALPFHPHVLVRTSVRPKRRGVRAARCSRQKRGCARLSCDVNGAHGVCYVCEGKDVYGRSPTPNHQSPSLTRDLRFASSPGAQQREPQGVDPDQTTGRMCGLADSHPSEACASDNTATLWIPTLHDRAAPPSASSPPQGAYDVIASAA